MTTPETIALFERYVVGNYRRFPVCLTRGQGSYVWDAEGTKYLDFFPGWGCNLLGHCPPRVVKAVQEQVAELVHVPNTCTWKPKGKWPKPWLRARKTPIARGSSAISARKPIEPSSRWLVS